MKASALMKRVLCSVPTISTLSVLSAFLLCGFLPQGSLMADSTSGLMMSQTLAQGGMNAIDLSILAVMVILLGLILFYAGNDKSHWRPYLIILVLLASILSIYYPGRYGPDMRLRKASDLEGGTTLIYEVAINEKQGPRSEVLEQTIQVLRERIDPNNLMNLVFRPQPPNRIEIEMSLAPPRVKKLRDTYTEAREKLLGQNLSQRVVDSLLRIENKSERMDRLKQLAGSSESLNTKLATLADKYDQKEAARIPYDKKQAEVFDVEEKVESLQEKQTVAAEKAEELSDADKKALEKGEADLKRALIELKPLAEASLAADSAFDEILDEVLTVNISATQLDRTLKLSNKPKTDKDGKEVASSRENAVNGLIAAYPARSAAIKEVFAAYAEYEKVRGPLDDYNDLVALIERSGVLEFRIVPEFMQLSSRAQEFRTTLQAKGPKAYIDGFKWVALDDAYYDSPSHKATVDANPQQALAAVGLIGDRYGDDIFVLLSDGESNSLTTRNEGWEVTEAYATPDQRGFNAVGFALNARGGYLMARMTGQHVKQQMAIVLDNKMRSAPVLQSEIADRGQITGGRAGFSPAELNSLIRTLNAGSLQAALRGPVSIQNVDSALGEHNKKAGIRAAMGAVILVAIFMLLYYYVIGVVANFAVFSNIVLILGWMALIQAQFTLPGIAALVLTVGMSVDANVLIFERIREELAQDMELETAIRLGYQKALSTILDANVTTFITCLVLGYMGTPEVKGFAITLSLGIFASMFTAIFCTRVIIDGWVKWKRPSSLAMAPIKFPALGKLLSPNIDWLAKRNQFRTASIALVVLSLFLVFSRSSELLDIEFSSGTQVNMAVKDDAKIDRETFEKRLVEAAKTEKLQRLADAQVQSTGLNDAGYPKGFKVTTLEENSDEVRRVLTQAFQDILVSKPAVSFKTVKTDALIKASPAVSTSDETAMSAAPEQKKEAKMTALREAPVFVINDDNLGRVIDRPSVTLGGEYKQLVRGYRGGVAIVVEDMKPAISTNDLMERIRTMRAKPPHNQFSAPRMDVIGLDAAQGTDQGGDSLWSGAVVLVQDEALNLLDEPGAFFEESGLANTQWELVHDALSRERSLGSVTNFTASVSQSMSQQAIIAMFVSLLCVVIYIWLRFGSLRYGMAAIAALVHDVSIALGAVALGGMLGLSLRIDLVMIGAFLTIVGYSLNDTIVIFDRIRENRGPLAKATEKIVNQSINQTISRTVLTTGTTFLAVLTLLLFGGDGIFGFAFSMAVGVVVGTYSSIGIAAPLLVGHEAPTTESDEADDVSSPAVTA